MELKHYLTQLQNCCRHKKLIQKNKSATKAVEALNQPKKSHLIKSLQKAFGQILNFFDFIADLAEVMTVKNTSYFRTIHDRELVLNFFKTICGVPFKNERKGYSLQTN